MEQKGTQEKQAKIKEQQNRMKTKLNEFFKNAKIPKFQWQNYRPHSMQLEVIILKCGKSNKDGGEKPERGQERRWSLQTRKENNLLIFG